MNNIETITQKDRMINAEPVVKDRNMDAKITVTKKAITITGRW